MQDLSAAIMAAHAAIRPHVPFSPLERSGALSAALDCDVRLKCDHLLPIGAFKVRGATNKISVLGEAARKTGVVTASTGNHGMAAAWAGARAGVPVTVYVPATAVRGKLDAIERLGARLVIVDAPPIEAERQARRYGAEHGIPYISPYNDFHIIAGQGTIGVEIAEQAGADVLDAVFVCVGGGGLVSGLGTAIKHLSPRTRVVGVWPENSQCMLRALEAGRIVDVEEQPTLSDATAGAVEEGSITFPICQQVIDDRVTVSETEIAKAMRAVAETDHWMVEGAAGVALAGLMQRKDEWRGKKVAVVLCGRNISVEKFVEAVG
ncbi:serine/threonine dehydratase [Bordetella genomosp. 8]|uniref:Serine/threonine dehydratase n=1 Tax=Bordetella genomosp. 8 TaxID=1416806 RepID=A0A1W6YRI8_9BORD|nr:threonine/serine dehydratase [Bordetella genomosp. 8]ARP83529.1 serine/threonine dehydratase [Bordetella genomosp. 8]